MRNVHEIRTYFHNNSLKTRTICNLCEASYPIETNLSNLKKHFASHHKQEYRQAMDKEEERRNQIKELNQQKEKERIVQKNINKQNNLIT